MRIKISSYSFFCLYVKKKLDRISRRIQDLALGSDGSESDSSSGGSSSGSSSGSESESEAEADEKVTRSGRRLRNPSPKKVSLYKFRLIWM